LTRKEQQALVRAVLYMSVEMCLLVIAEGVESVEHNDMLRGMDCGYGQGYLYSKPMPLLQATEWLRAKSTD
jgi:EAL domain-containing protein (putative c-di-GMP-specific phosphodiesterase class I)